MEGGSVDSMGGGGGSEEAAKKNVVTCDMNQEDAGSSGTQESTRWADTIPDEEGSTQVIGGGDEEVISKDSAGDTQWRERITVAGNSANLCTPIQWTGPYQTGDVRQQTDNGEPTQRRHLSNRSNNGTIGNGKSRYAAFFGQTSTGQLFAGEENCREEVSSSSMEDDRFSRKRNRLEGKEAGTGFNVAGAGEALEKLITCVGALTRASSRGSALKEAVEEAAMTVTVEIAKLLTKLTQRQEENSHLLQQVVQLQAARAGEGRSTAPTYAEIAGRGPVREIASGKMLPTPRIPTAIKMSPAERTIIIKSDNREGIASKQQQMQFRDKLREAVGHDLAGEISAVRPTRHGGYTLVAATEAARDLVAEKMIEGAVTEENNVLKPKKRTARMVCRRPPDMSTTEFLKCLYGRHNPELAKVPAASRTATIHMTRLGWVFNLSSLEAMACDAQGGRIRHSFGMEALLEEFIPLQQCYNCCGFGHRASNCKAQTPKCRLCGMSGHSGRSCPQRDERTVWRCHNCRMQNEKKGTKLDDRHAAAQLHLCPVAIREKEIRRAQLGASGVYVTTRPLGKPAGATLEEIEAVREAPHVSRPRESAEATDDIGQTAQSVGRVRQAIQRLDQNVSSTATQLREPIQSAGQAGVGRVTWEDREGERRRGGETWNVVGGGGRRVTRSQARRGMKTPVTRGRGGGNAGREDRRFLTPGTTVQINSVTEDEDLDI